MSHIKQHHNVPRNACPCYIWPPYYDVLRCTNIPILFNMSHDSLAILKIKWPLSNMVDFKRATTLNIYSKMYLFPTILHLYKTIVHFLDCLKITTLYCDFWLTLYPYRLWQNYGWCWKRWSFLHSTPLKNRSHVQKRFCWHSYFCSFIGK